MRAPPDDLIISQRPHPPNTIDLGVRISTSEFGGDTNIPSRSDGYNGEGSRVDILGSKGECNTGKWERKIIFSFWRMKKKMGTGGGGGGGERQIIIS